MAEDITADFTQAAAKAVAASNIAHEWANGGDTTEIPTESGPLPSLRKFMFENVSEAENKRLDLVFVEGETSKVLSSEDFFSSLFFRVSGHTTIVDIVLPSIAKVFYIENTGSSALRIVKGSSFETVAMNETVLGYTDGTTNGLTLILPSEVINNYTAQAAPTVNDDSTQGYSVGSRWIDNSQTPAVSYTALDVTEGAAFWAQTGVTIDDLGDMATQNSNSVTITGGSVTGVTGVQLENPLLTDLIAENYIGRKNYIINGNFDIWQRGTSQTSSGYGSDDRWLNAGIGSTKTHARQAFTLGQTDVPNEPEFYSRTVVSSVAGAGNNVLKIQKIESVRSLAGQTVTLSFYAKADASKNIAIEFVQIFGTGGTPSDFVVGIGSQLITLTTTWQKHTITLTIPSIAGKTLGTNGDDTFQLNFWFDAGSDFNARAANLGQQSGTFDIAQVQLEKGSVATDFEYRTIGEELALCQRFYWRGCAGTNYNQFTTGVGQAASWFIPFPVTMRAIPSLTSSGLAGFFYQTFAFNAPSLDGGRLIASDSSGTAASANMIVNSSGYLAADAEL